MRAYHITPTRMMTTPFLWKSVNMMKYVNRDRVFVVTPETREWLRAGHWTTVTPENLALCFQYSDRPLGINWDANSLAAQKVMDVFIGNAELREIALGSRYLRPEMYTTFMESTYKDAVIEHAALLKKAADSYRFTGNVTAWTPRLLSRADTYHIEFIWDIHVSSYGTEELIAYEVASSAPIDKIPDHLIQKMLPFFLPKRNGCHNVVAERDLFREAIRRQLLVMNTPSTVVVGSQPRPVFVPKSL